VLRDEGAKRIGQVRGPAGLDLLEELEHLEDTTLASRRRHSRHHAIGQGNDGDPIEVR
jgi:hypothetical protein